MYDAPEPVLTRAERRSPMQVGPGGEGELEVLVRLLCGLTGAGFGALFLALVAGNFGGHATLRELAAVYVTILVVSVFLPEVAVMVQRSQRARRSSR